MSLLVSIITPTYNHAAYIEACITSVQAQTYTNWEMIVVNDGSTDQTAQLVRALAEHDPRITLIDQPNVGPLRLDQTYNTALARARGELIAVLEGDDFWPPDKLSLQVPLHTPGVIMSYGRFELDTPTGRLPGPKPTFEGALQSSAFLREVMLGRSQMLAVTQIISALALKVIGGFLQDSSPGAVDMATLLALAQLDGEVVYSPLLLGYWRQHAGQSTQVRGLKLVEHNLLLSLKTLNSLPETQRHRLNVSEAQVVAARQAQLADAYLGAMRHCLIERNRSEARVCASKLWRAGGPRRKVQAALGQLGALGGFDLEPVFRYFDPAARR